MQRLVKTLDLKKDRELIRRYCEIHAHIWPEIREGIRRAGISGMEIYLLDNHAVMIIEMEEGLDPEEVFARLGACPRQEEWERHVSRFQECDEKDTSAEKWKPMTRIFEL